MGNLPNFLPLKSIEAAGSQALCKMMDTDMPPVIARFADGLVSAALCE
jgi:hypothetical protein|tara:strand:+ start:367 stop:510 length:144 start_codon:yes stop_codon:yes gene_type:complete